MIENIDPDPHQLVLSRSGYLDARHPFWIGAGQRSDIRITLSATTSQTGSVSIVSSPPGADLFVDGGYRGRTPITISGLAGGRHPVVLELPGYVRHEDTVEVQNGVMTYLDPVLTPTSAVGFLSVVSSPAGAFVYVDGVYRGVTPLTVAATTGARRIQARSRRVCRLVEHRTGHERSHGPGERAPAAPSRSPRAAGSRSRPNGREPRSTWTTSTRGVTGASGDLEADRGGRRESHPLGPARGLRRVPRHGPGNAGRDGHDQDAARTRRQSHRDHDLRSSRRPRGDPGEHDAGERGTVGPSGRCSPRGTRGRRGGSRPARQKARIIFIPQNTFYPASIKDGKGNP